MDLQSVFDKLVDITEPICRDIDNNLASMLLFDTSGIEAYVTENNPKYANRIIRQLKSYAKSMNFDSSYDPYKVAYAFMPTSASSKHEVKQQYINGHFCYAYKFGIITDGLGIVRYIDFYNKDYLALLPEIVVEKKAKSPDEHKSLADSKALLPTLKNFKTRRGSKEWDETYKIRVNVEKSINHFKDSFYIAKRKTTNEKTLHSDLLLAGISQLLTVVVADNINLRQHIRSLKSLIA